MADASSRALNAQVEELTAANQRMSQALGNLGDELRAPLTMVCILIEEAAQGRTEMLQAALPAMRQHCERLQGMIDQLLDFQRAEASRLEAKPESFKARIERLIDLHMHEDTFDVAALAKMAPLSRAQLHRRLMVASGYSPSELIRARRLDHARDLIVRQAGTISEIAYAVGFASLDGFTRAFHHRYGMTPSEFLRHPPDQ